MLQRREKLLTPRLVRRAAEYESQREAEAALLVGVCRVHAMRLGGV